MENFIFCAVFPAVLRKGHPERFPKIHREKNVWESLIKLTSTLLKTYWKMYFLVDFTKYFGQLLSVIIKKWHFISEALSKKPSLYYYYSEAVT